jgi:AcrR family transcriptional regulator
MMKSKGKEAKARMSSVEARQRIIAAAAELIREGGYGTLSVAAVMERAGIQRTLFYRYFEDTSDLLMKACGEAVEAMYAIQAEIVDASAGLTPEELLAAIKPAVAVFSTHGPLLDALSQAAYKEPAIAAAQEELRARYDELVVAAMRTLPAYAELPKAELTQVARALNLLNTAYLRDAFGGPEPRVSKAKAAKALTTIWASVFEHGAGAAG